MYVNGAETRSDDDMRRQNEWSTEEIKRTGGNRITVHRRAVSFRRSN